MKILKYIGLGALVLFLLVCLVSLLLPSHYLVERNQEIKSDSKSVYEEISNYQNWEHWSSWKERDSTIVNTITGQPGTVGHKLSWTSEQSGNGSMTITGVFPTDSLTMVLVLDDMDMEGHVLFTLSPASSAIKLSWSISGDLSFFSRIFGLMMGNMMAPDFEKGLLNIKNYLENKPAVKEPAIGMVIVKAQPMLTVLEKCAMTEIGQTLGKLYGEIMVQMNMQGLKQAGPPFAIYHSFSHTTVELEAGIPVDRPGANADRVMAGEIKAGNAIKADYYGPYEGTEAVHASIDSWVKANGKTVIGPPWEVYVTDPGVEKDPSKVLTQIFYPVQ